MLNYLLYFVIPWTIHMIQLTNELSHRVWHFRSYSFRSQNRCRLCRVLSQGEWPKCSYRPPGHVTRPTLVLGQGRSRHTHRLTLTPPPLAPANHSQILSQWPSVWCLAIPRRRLTRFFRPASFSYTSDRSRLMTPWPRSRRSCIAVPL